MSFIFCLFLNYFNQFLNTLVDFLMSSNSSPSPYRDAIPNAKWYNCSLIVRAPKYLICLGEAIKFFFNPILMSLFLETLFIVLYFCDFKHSEEIHSYLCELHHLILPPMVQIVGLYGIFRQRRPTRKYVNGVYYNLGTIYGMPSGDAFYAGVICHLLFKKAPIFSILLIICICFSRTIVGYHTILQVLVGVSAGILLCFAKDLIPHLTFIRLNWWLSSYLPLIIFFDKMFETVDVGDYNNLQIWVVIDSAYIAFDYFYCAPKELMIFPELSNGCRLSISIFLVLFFHVLSTFLYMNGISIVKLIKNVF